VKNVGKDILGSALALGMRPIRRPLDSAISEMVAATVYVRVFCPPQIRSVKACINKYIIRTGGYHP